MTEAEVATMEKLLALARRPAGTGREAFCTEFLSVAQRALDLHPEIAALVVDLVDIPAAEAGLRPGGEPSYDAVAEVWLDRDNAGPPAMPLDLPGTTQVYRVRETVKREYERAWPLGERSPGVKSIYLARRRPEMTQDEYAAYWSEQHAPLALRIHVGMWRYVQNVVIESAPGSDRWDGFAVLHFRSSQDLRDRFYDSEEGRAAIAADVAEFTSGGRVLHTSEHILKV